MVLYLHSPHTPLLANGILCLYYIVKIFDNILMHICYAGTTLVIIHTAKRHL